MTEHPTAQAGAPVIEMTGIAVGALRDPDTTVAEGINWTVNAGDYWVVAGLHGSGKSDFLMLTSGLMAPPRLPSRVYARTSSWPWAAISGSGWMNWPVSMNGMGCCSAKGPFGNNGFHIH